MSVLKRTPVATAVLLALGSPSVLAQETTTLGEVVVTAQKRAQNLQDVPISVSAVSSEDIREQKITSLADVASQVSGFQFGEVAGGGQASIRGVGFSLVTGAGEGSVAIHSDGLFLSRPGESTMLQQDLAGIEVLRGPQGTLYGRNATAGVVNLISPPPPDTLQFGASAGVANLGGQSYAAHVGDGFLDGKLRLRLGGSMEERDDYLENESFPGRDQNGMDQYGLRLSADADLTDWLHLQFRGFDAREDFNGPLYAAYKPDPESVLAPPGSYSDDPYRIRTNDDGDATKEMLGGSVKLIVNLSDALTLSSQSGYVDYGFDTDHYDGDGTSNDLFTAYREDNSETFTQEVILSWDRENWQWLLGGFYLEENYFLDNNIFTSAAGLLGAGIDRVFPGLSDEQVEALTELLAFDAINIRNTSVESSHSKAVFGDTTYGITDWLRVFGGLRYLEDRKVQHITSGIYPAGFENGPVGVVSCTDLRSVFDTDSTTGRLGLQVDVTDDVMTYVQYSTGYKTGGFSIGKCGNVFKPEKLKAWEAGIKSTWFDGRLRANGAVFFYDYDNLQVEQVVLPTVVINNAQAKVKGAEAELTALPIRPLTLGLAVTLLDTKYTEFFNSDSASQVIGAPEQDLSGNKLNRSPEFAGAFSAQYNVDLARWGGLSLRGEATYQTKMYLREFNLPTDAQKAVDLYDAFLTWFSPTSAWSVRGYVKNIGDEPVLAGFLGVGGYKTATFQLPRTYGVTIGYEFQ